MKVTPYDMESLTSFISRAAAMNSMDYRSYLRSLFQSDDYMNPIALPEDLDALDHGVVLAGLNDALDPIKRRLELLTFPTAKPGVHTKWLRRAGGCNMGGDHFSKVPFFAWCPRCLLMDQLNGHDQFLRLSWRLITRTFCLRHRRPLTTHCLACNDREAGPTFVFDGSNVILACSACGSPYGTQLGLPDMSASTTIQLRDNRRVQIAWNGAIQLEMELEKSLSERSKTKNKREFQNFILAFANILMKANPYDRAPIDLFSSVAFPARPNPRNITSMDRPYRASSISVRRKTHGFLAALLKRRVTLFSIKGVHERRWGRDPTMQELRSQLEPEQNDELDQLLLMFPAKWF
ncbi:TniQ family protein [Aliiroseovarius sp. CAU 1755]|uniref:TniQ family protein n=1 Tax=Aliiroseovarius sp. S1339 TaxID=2936990 RepID=UPI0020BDDD93|nr:TniQ family protein [Aliiroseovarius sp. S1339]MCK8463528.1 TniQ family protein [Aliiroseovarius sp. S1339]